jgi:hypothetical protein
VAVMAESCFVKAGAQPCIFSKDTGRIAQLRMNIQADGFDRPPHFHLPMDVDRLTSVKQQFAVTAKIDLFSNWRGSPALIRERPAGACPAVFCD